jgi:hypothetical protein
MLHLYQDQPIGGADILNSLADVNINNPENKQIIYYDQATGTWRNYDPPFVNSENVLHTVEECAASTNPEDVAGASVASSLNSALTISKYEASTFTVWKIGKTVYFISKAWIVSNSSVPPEYKPDKTYYFPATDNTGAAIYVAIDPTDGKLINQRNSNNFITCATWYTD